MDVLSASSYPVPTGASCPPLAAVTPNSGRVLYGGLIETDGLPDSGPVESDAVEIKRPRKRSRQHEKSDDDESRKRQRGRPRVISQDETAADRRRTQIRLAQRAYRLRKETTIDALKKRVADLEDHIGQMAHSFQQFSDNTMDSGALAMHPRLAQQLGEMTEQFSILARIASPGSDSDEKATGETIRTDDVHKEDPMPVAGSTDSPYFVRQDAGSRIWNSLFWKDPVSEDVITSQTQHLQYESHVSKSPKDLSRSLEVPESGITTSVLARIQQWSQHLSEAYSPPIERSLRSESPYTYSFQESSFARRLHRASIEHGFRLLTTPTTDPQQISTTFRFTFCFADRKRILSRFQEILKRGNKDSLENWHVPYVRIGGAGTHYPRIDDEGRRSFPPNMISASTIFYGPMQGGAETPRDEKTIEDILEAIGYGGKWFDSNDVENYLRHRGVYLDGQSSFVEVPVSNLSTPLLTSDEDSRLTSISPSPFSRSPAVETPRRPSRQRDSPEVVSSLETGVMPEAVEVPGNSTNEFASWSQNFEQSFIDVWQQEQANQIAQELVTIDVQKFLDSKLMPCSAQIAIC